jgi:hypothetical protein
LINITIPAGTLLGWSNTPADVGAWGLMDASTVRDLIEAASRHPRTRWCYTVTGPGGEAVAHACARGSHPWPGPQAGRDEPADPARPNGPASPADPTSPADPPGPASPARPTGPTGPSGRDGPGLARLAALLAGLNAVPEPIARGTCDHAHREDRYIPSRKLKHLVRARTARCPGPGCGAQAVTGHIDHTIPYPAGDTCEENLSPPCARHHHAKHAPGWALEQPQPGVMRWTTPSGRIYTTYPTQYDE